MPVTPARDVAFQILLRVETRASYAAELLHSTLTARLSEPDLRLATELVMGVERWRGQLDFLVEKLSGKRAETLDPEVLIALRLGIYQIRFLEKIPRHAAVNESVELAKKAHKRSAAGFVNAVLRKVTRAAITQLLPDKISVLERLAILHSHPAWLLDRWMQHFGEKRAMALARANNVAAATTLRLVAARAPRERILELLGEDGVECGPGGFLADCVRVVRGHVTASEVFRWRWVTIQDEASQMVADLVGPRPGEHVLDLCAAPGGKSAQLAETAGPSGMVIACDVHLSRLRRMKDLLADDLELSLVCLDGTQPLPFGFQFDRILVDVPCSGTGTLRGNPEIKWRLRPADLTALATKQAALLRNALRYLKPGGRLVYSTCSLELEENESVVSQVLESESGFKRICPVEELRPHARPGADVASLFDVDGYFRTFPPTHHTDGFFAAAIEKQIEP